MTVAAAPSHRIEFANQLRGVAALLVLAAHYVGVLPALQGEYGGFPATAEPFFVGTYGVLTLGVPNLNWGPFGVALFFLISGFVIPFSLARVVDWRSGARFLVARYARLWPVYAAGLTVSATCLWLSYRYTGLPYPWSPSVLAANTTFFRDWIGVPQVDGVVWTLEVEMKFYLLSALCAAGTRRGWPVVGLLAGALAVIAHTRGVTFPLSWNPPDNFLFAMRYVLYISIGTAFYHLHTGTLGKSAATATIVASMALFLALANGELRLNYLLALLVFSLTFALRRNFSRNRVMGFLADISFPLYAVHGAMGLLGLRVMIGNGVDPWIALPLQVSATLVLAWMLHRAVERPAHWLSRQISRSRRPAAAPRVDLPLNVNPEFHR